MRSLLALSPICFVLSCTAGCNSSQPAHDPTGQMAPLEGVWEQVPRQLAVAAGCPDHKDFIEPAPGGYMARGRGSRPLRVTVAGGDVIVETEHGRRAFYRVPYEATSETGRVKIGGDWRYSHLAERSPGAPATDGAEARMIRFYGLNEPDYDLVAGFNHDGQFATLVFQPSQRWMNEMLSLREAEVAQGQGQTGPNAGLEMITRLPNVFWCRRTDR